MDTRIADTQRALDEARSRYRQVRYEVDKAEVITDTALARLASARAEAVAATEAFVAAVDRALTAVWAKGKRAPYSVHPEA